ncbi:hypothetical protein Leryth_011412, partial [Lithospermum erythrorhizon]
MQSIRDFTKYLEFNFSEQLTIFVGAFEFQNFHHNILPFQIHLMISRLKFDFPHNIFSFSIQLRISRLKI